ncbi:transglycosylase family protein [Pseudonocardia sp. T1-2H]|uniref:transglycosylase family protein n=1 Tax=Pseudonocardia sp. T1-2H TaxID=3128899 RepID=UPI003100F827
MSGMRKAAFVAVTTAALTAGPAAGAALATPVLTDAPTCTQTSSAGQASDGQASGSGTTGAPQLSEEGLAQAEELVEKTRELLTTLTTAAGDPRASALGGQLRAMGVTPAVATGWRQQAHDLADTLLTNPDPKAAQLAVTLAGSGYSPTPADLRTPPAQDPTPASTGGSSPAPALVPASHPSTSSAGGSAMAAVLQNALDAALDADTGSSPADTTSSGLQTCGQNSPSAGPDPAGGSAAEGPGAGKGETPQRAPAGPAGSPNSADGAGSAGRDISSSAPRSSVHDAWEQQAQDLVEQLDEAPADPDAAALAEKLKATGLLGAGPDGADAGNDVGTGRQDDNAAAGTHLGGQSSSDPTASAGNTAGAAGSSTGSDEPGTSSSGTSSSGASSSGTAAGSGGWEAEASQLVADLAAAPDDPTAQELAAKLAAAGITSPAADSASGTTGAETADRRTGEPADSGANPDEPAGASSSGSGSTQEQPEDGAPTAGTPSDGSSSADVATAEPASEPGSSRTWEQLARCESGGDWTTATGNGYSGGLQFDAATWKAYGGDRYASSAEQASKDQQIAVAEKVRRDRGGYSAWPACSKRLGLA